MNKDIKTYDFIVVGGGPSGAFFAYEMLKNRPDAKILVLERGKPVEKRSCPETKLGKCVKCKPFCNITCGFSGAGAFSDGKLSLILVLKKLRKLLVILIVFTLTLELPKSLKVLAILSK